MVSAAEEAINKCSLYPLLVSYPSGVPRNEILTLMLINARSIEKKSSLIYDLIMDEDIDLACFTETCAVGEADVVQAMCPPLPRFQCSTSAMARGAG